MLIRNGISILIVSFLFNLHLAAQSNFEKNDSSVIVYLSNGSLSVEFCSDKAVHIIHSPAKKMLPQKSLIIKGKSKKLPFEISNEKDFLKIRTKDLIVNINKKSGQVRIIRSDGKVIFQENETSPASFIPAIVMSEKTYHARLYLKFSKDEAIYGFGQHQDGIMNYRSHDVELVQENTQVAIPFILSTLRYGLMFDNYSKIIFHDKGDSSYVWFEVADVIDYYVITSIDMDGVIKGYRELTGKAPLFAKWAYGYFQSKERYKTQQEILEVANEFRARRIPMDCIIQDWQYWGEDNSYWNSMRFDSIRYPDPKQMLDELHSKYNIHFMVSIWPVAGAKTSLYKELDQRGLLFSPYHWTDGRTYDAYSPEARKLYWDAVNNGLFSLGVDAFWMDATEPEVVLAPNERSIKEAKKNSLSTMARYLNPYSLLATEAVYNGQRSVTSEKRVCILTRSAFLSQQKNAAITWSGDIVADWKVMHDQISAGLNFCMSGLPYWTNDIGGFHVNRYGAFEGGCDNPGYQELYVRWFQFGAFNPVFRSHGTDTPREPWHFGQKGSSSWAYNALILYDRLRYRLLPYIYSLAWQVTNNSYTIMRGLAMDYPDDKSVYNITDQFMFGPFILVSPVIKHMYFGKSYANETIPPERLRAPGGEEGYYRAQYFNGTSLDTLVVDSLQTLTLFDLYLGKDLPPLVNWEHNSIRWTGSFKTKSKGNYELWITADDAVKFSLNNKLLVDAWNAKGKDTTYVISLPLEGETWYDFKIEYARMANTTKLRFAWRTPEMFQENFDTIAHVGSRTVYLPKTKGGWFDFWSGEHQDGGKIIERKVPIDIMPLYIKAGSIIPMGPDKQYALEKTDDMIELRIFTGDNAYFELYDDKGDGYDYEKGEYSIIPFLWDEALQTLSIGQRKGRFPAMPEKIKFNIVWVKDNHGIGVDSPLSFDSKVIYDGKEIKVRRK